MQKFVNNWSTTLQAPLLAADSEMQLPSALAALLLLGEGDYYDLTLDPQGPAPEIVRVTAVGVDVATLDSRGLEGTAPSDWPAGTVVECCITAGLLDRLQSSEVDPCPWGTIAGDIENQTDLMQLLGDLEDSIPTTPADTDELSEGSTNLYHTAARVRAAVLTGLSKVTTTAIDATDSVLQALGKLAGRLETAFDRGNHTGTQDMSTVSGLTSALDGKQATLVSATNIKTINGENILGSGNLVVAGSGAVSSVNGKTGAVQVLVPIIVACSDEVTVLAAGPAKVTFRMPYAFTVTAVSASLTAPQTSGAILTVDINDGGTSILSTKLTIDNTEKTSATAETAPVISESSIAADSEITIDIDQVGVGDAKGLKVTLVGYQP